MEIGFVRIIIFFFEEDVLRKVLVIDLYVVDNISLYSNERLKLFRLKSILRAFLFMIL